MMKPTIPLLTALLLAPLAALPAADKAGNPGLPQLQGIGPIEGAPAIAMDGPPKLILNPWAREAYTCAKREEDVLAGSDRALACVKANRRLVSKGGVQ